MKRKSDKKTLRNSKMNKKVIKQFLLICIMHFLCLRPISAVQIVEVPPEFHNRTFDYNHTNINYESVMDEELEIRTLPPGSADKATPKSDTPNPEDNPGNHPCNRKCIENSPSMTCHYSFRVEHYQTMSKACHDCPFNMKHCNYKDCIPGDGIKRTLTVVNRLLPGPAIEVCQGDTIVVNVENALSDGTTSIHWHGQHQKGSPFMDGVPKVTQCPIHPGTKFVYKFNASTPGTHFWHSHSGLQRSDGTFGALIVRLPRSRDPFSDYYDYDLSEHVMSITEWTSISSLSKFIYHHHSDGDNKPENILINGKGRLQEFENEYKEILYTPLEKFTVRKGYRYRFRLINSGSLNCPIEASVDNHTMVIINGDGEDLEPVEAKSLVTYAGERFDFIIDMNQPVKNYWIRFRGLMDCDERFHSVYQVAILHYAGADENTEPEGELAYDILPQGLQVNSLNKALNTSGSLITPELRSIATSRKDPRLKQEADVKFYISYDFYPKDNAHFHRPRHYGFNETEKSQRIYTPQLNFISMTLPPFPLMTNLKESNKLDFCNSTALPKECSHEYCECIHLLRVAKDAVVEMIILDKGVTYDANHPFHLHGHNFRVIGMDRLGSTTTEEEIRELDKMGLLMRNLKDAPIKDTVNVPDGGYTILRWQATNPGYWLFHCHIEFHMEIGMALLFKVGEDSDIPRVPKNFPQCYNYYPEEETDEDRTALEDTTDSLLNEIEDSYLKQLYGLFNGCSSNSISSTSTMMTLFMNLFIFLWSRSPQVLQS